MTLCAFDYAARDDGKFDASCPHCGRLVIVSTQSAMAACRAFSDYEAAHDRLTGRVSGGPGTELSKLLKRFGIEPTPTCACRAKAAQMDAWGCDECSRPERIDEVVAVMREEAKARGLPFLDAAGRVLVKRAIKNAKRATA
jgi:hypothetical protein